MDLIYKIYSVYLYDNGLAHDWVFFYNRTKGFTGEVKWDAPYTMFGSSSFCDNNQIFNMDKSQPDFNEMSVRVMKSAAQSEGIDLIRVKDFLILEKIGTTHMPNYNAYQILWNETKSSFNVTRCNSHRICLQVITYFILSRCHIKNIFSSSFNDIIERVQLS